MSADDLDAALSAAQDDATCIICGAETSGPSFYCRDHKPHLRTT
jgi:hypothetical protein